MRIPKWLRLFLNDIADLSIAFYTIVLVAGKVYFSLRYPAILTIIDTPNTTTVTAAATAK